MKKIETSSNLILRMPQMDDLSALQDFEARNKAHLGKWETLADFENDEFRKRLANWILECEEGRSARFLIFEKGNSEQIIGMCNLTQIFRGAFQACYLGYKIDHEFEGKGIMFEALQMVIHYAFEDLQLHRIMANYMPRNVRSEKLLKRLGFVVEGFAKNYLLINGTWEDHTLTALSYEQWKK